MSDTNRARQRLQALRDEYTHRLDALGKDLHHENQPVEKDFAEQATQMENRVVLEALDDEAREQVIMIDAALGRIAAGTYGICGNCGAAIAASRLEAVPYTALCINCADV